MTSRVTPKQCDLAAAVGEQEVCPGAWCVFWEEGGSVIEQGCAIERLGVPVGRDSELARHLLELRRTAEAARDELDRREAYRRFREILNIDGD